jgi:hypothetical protein
MGNLDSRGDVFVVPLSVADATIAGLTDVGVKTASFNGAIQSNPGARGALITILLGAVSGTSPTLAVQLQWSPDGGTTWLNFGAVLPNLTASNQIGTILVFPTNTSTAGASPAAFTMGSATNVQSNVALPKTWRLVYTLGGTSPSFTINSIQINYLQ